MKTTLALLCLVLLAGCHRPLSGKKDTPSAVSKFSTTPLPVPPPLPDPKPAGDDVTGAASDVAAAQANVQQVLKVAETTPAAGAAVAPLTSADTHLTAAAGKLGDATARITELGQQLAASETAHQTAEGILRKDIDTLKAAAGADAATNAKQVAALTKENADLRDESIQQAKTRLMWMGILLIVGGVGSFAAGMYLGFLAGPKVAVFMIPAGVFLITLSQLLQKIILAGEIASVVGVVGLCAWLLYHAFHHVPVKPVEVKP